MAGTPELCPQSGRGHFLRSWILGYHERNDQLPVHSGEADLRHFIPVVFRCCRSSAFHDESSCGSHVSGRYRSRVATNVRVERRGRAQHHEGRRPDTDVRWRRRTQADEKDIYIAPGPNFSGEFDLLSNHGTSNYDALQAQYRHRLSHGLQTLLSYTWGHSIDDVSSDVNYRNVPLGLSPSSTERGPSDCDIRNTLTSAVSYDIAGPSCGVLKQVFGHWSSDAIIYARSAPPVNVVTGQNPFAGSVLAGADSVQRPDIVPNVQFYLYPSGAPGGKVINPAAFTTPVPATVQGDLGRNALRGFGATQWDMAVRRQFRFTERLALQARADFFNMLNHPNFGSPINYLSSPQFGQATMMLNNYLGSGGQGGGLNPLYQIGGPRSIQLALKLQF